MARIIIVYGLIAGGVVALVSFGSLALLSDGEIPTGSKWLGYSIMLIALSVIFFAVKSYRDQQLGGVIKFWTALKLGFGISLMAAVVYALGWELYYQTLGGDFMQQYTLSYLEQMRVDGATSNEIETARQRMADFERLYSLLPARFGITLVEILPIGLVISLLSAALLRKQ